MAAKFGLLPMAALLCAFFAGVLGVVLRYPQMFMGRFGRSHRLLGLALLCWLVLGCADALAGPLLLRVPYDAALGLLGTATTLSAAFGFRQAHQRVRNRASGTLDKDATVSYDEMLEHGFYQMLNLIQIMYLHGAASLPDVRARAALALAATAPWLLRGHFPVNHFSDNYTKGQDPTSLISVLYRLKKYQYVFYKHSLLHGMNVSIAVDGGRITEELYFRVYWVCLNTAYVMEFFLQTLVKRQYLQQGTMLLLQQVLMLVSTLAALQVLMNHVYVIAALVSLMLNFIHRHHEVTNTTAVLAVTLAYAWAGGWPSFAGANHNSREG